MRIVSKKLQAEFELLLQSAGDQEVKQDSEKRARLNKAQKGNGDEADEGDKGKGKGKRYNNDGERPFCWIYGKTDAGCRFGSRCKFRHDKDSLERGRCFECGAVGQLQPQCPYKDGAVSMQTRIQKEINPQGILPKGGKAAKVRNGEMPKRQKWLKEEMRRLMWDRKEVLQVPHHHQHPIKSLLRR